MCGVKMIGNFGHQGVNVFFIISGFVIPFSMYASQYNMKHIWKFIVKRLVRIEIPYLSLIIIEIVAIYISSWTPWRAGISERLDWSIIFLHLGYLNSFFDKPWLIPVFWTLAIEFQFYLIIAITLPLIIDKRPVIRIGILVMLLVLKYYFPQQHLFFTHSTYFLFGITLFQFVVLETSIFEYILGLLFLTLVLFVDQSLWMLIVVAGTLIIIRFQRVSWQCTFFLGSISYSIYLIHVPFGGRLLALVQMMVIDERLKSLFILCLIPITIVSAWVFYKLIEKPALNLSKKITYNDF